MAESDLIRGNVDTVILKVLYEGDRYGYDLIRQINAKSDGAWEIKQPTVYACLKRLEKQGFVSSYWDSSESDGGRRKYYSLTDSGKEVFLQYKNEFERANALFGGIILGNEPVFLQTADDYADVEEEGYSVPKRRPSRGKRVKPQKRDRESEGNVSALSDERTDAPADEPAPAPPRQTEYVQPDLFSIAEQVEQSAEKQTDKADAYDSEPLPARTAVDPRAIIDRYYAAERGESFSDVVEKTVYSDDRSGAAASTRQQSPAPAPPAPVAVRPTPAPAPVTEKNIAESVAEQKSAAVSPPPAPLGFAEDEESPARREYKTVLSDLVDRFEVAPPDMHDGASASADEQAAAEMYREQAEGGKTFRLGAAALERGNDVKVRDHNDSAKEYAHKYYYYSNRLMMTHYTIMCPIMLLLGFVLFFTFHSGLGMKMRYDYLLYIAAGLLPIVMFIVAVIRFAGEPGKKKRVNVNFRLSIVIRLAIMVQVAVVIYCVNLIWGMPIAFSAAYLPSLIIPLTYALFIPISEIIFMALLDSGHYAAE